MFSNNISVKWLNNTFNIKLSNSQVNKLKFRIKNATEITLKHFITFDDLNVIGDSNKEKNVLHKLLLTNTLLIIVLILII